MLQLPAFIALLFRHGTLFPRAPLYRQLRKRYLHGLDAYLPKGETFGFDSDPPSNWLSFVAWVKYSVYRTGGHLVHPDKVLYYIRIPKCGNTSLSKALLRARFPDLPDLNATQINFLSDAWIEQRIDERKLKQATGFTVVRHPLQRLVSVYRDFFEYPRDDFFIYHGYLFNILEQQISFEEFVKRISKIPLPLLDPHLRPQYFFLRPYHRKKIKVKVFKLEEADALHEFLRENNMTLYHENRSAANYDYRDYFTSSLKRRALRVYADDCEVFGYEH